MKKLLVIGICLSFFVHEAFPQDRIITIYNDTISCRITRITRSDIFFTRASDSKGLTEKLPLIGILDYRAEGSIMKNKDTKTEEPFRRLQFGINGGAGFLLGSTREVKKEMISSGLTSGQADSYYKDLVSGYNLSAGLNYLFTPETGAGIKYKFFSTSSATTGFFDPQDGVNLIYTTYSEHIYVNFAGPSIVYRRWLGTGEKFRLLADLSLGLANYRNEAELLNGYYLIRGNTIGGDANIGMEYKLNDFLSLCMNISSFYSTLRKVRISDGSGASAVVRLEKGEYEDLSRLDLSLGILINIRKR